jgi:hypothetical protein
MESFQSRLSAFYGQDQRATFQERFRLLWAIAAGACYWLWYSLPGPSRVFVFASIFGVAGLVALIWALQVALRIRRVINRLRSMAPEERDEVMGRHFSPEIREFYEKRLAAEGSIEFDGVVERFPFSPVERREAVSAFWGATIAAGIMLSAALGLLGTPDAWRGLELFVGAIAVVAMPILTRRLERLSTVIEVTPFAIIEVRPGGQRRWLYWRQPLAIRNRRWLRRVELSPNGARDFIPLHYARVSFDRLLALVLERGGFKQESPAA